jgi:hypothetical protein
VPGANPSPQHDVTDGSERGDLRYRSLGTNAQRVVLGISERMAAVDGQHANPSIYGVCRHDAEFVPTAPHRAQHVAGSALLGA